MSKTWQSRPMCLQRLGAKRASQVLSAETSIVWKKPQPKSSIHTHVYTTSSEHQGRNVGPNSLVLVIPRNGVQAGSFSIGGT